MQAFTADDDKVKYTNSKFETEQTEKKMSVTNLISRFENISFDPKPMADDHAIVDDVDVNKLTVILGHEPENREIADINLGVIILPIVAIRYLLISCPSSN